MAKENWIGKDDRSIVAKKHVEEMEKKYKTEIENSYKYTVEFVDGKLPDVISKKNYNMVIKVTSDDSVSAIFNELDGKTAILNFASYKEPGGAFLAGAMAQEEALCHCSTLYNVLNKCREMFYDKNVKKLNRALYHDNLLYSPNICFFKDNKAAYCDVITCAAPNRTAAQRYQNVPNEEIHNILISRIDHILYSAYRANVQTLILGAFGCGVFGNNPAEVAEIFKEFVLGKYKQVFKKVVFAIPAGNNNNLAEFQKVFEIKY